MDAMNTGSLVSSEWLALHLDSPWLKVLDISCHLPNSGRNGRLEFQNEHLPKSIYFDLLAAADPGSKLSHTLPSPNIFQSLLAIMELLMMMRLFYMMSVELDLLLEHGGCFKCLVIKEFSS